MVTLFHGTLESRLNGIRESGLVASSKPMLREGLGRGLPVAIWASTTEGKAWDWAQEAANYKYRETGEVDLPVVVRIDSGATEGCEITPDHYSGADQDVFVRGCPRILPRFLSVKRFADEEKFAEVLELIDDEEYDEASNEISDVTDRQRFVRLGQVRVRRHERRVR